MIRKILYKVWNVCISNNAEEMRIQIWKCLQKSVTEKCTLCMMVNIFLKKYSLNLGYETFFRKWIGRYQWCIHWQWYIPTRSSITWCWNCGKKHTVFQITKFTLKFIYGSPLFIGSSKIVFQPKFHKWWICHWWYSWQRCEICNRCSIRDANRSVHILFQWYLALQ